MATFRKKIISFFILSIFGLSGVINAQQRTLHNDSETYTFKTPYSNRLECTVKSFENGILIGKIVNVSADERVITDGKVDLSKLKPIAFDPFNNAYVGIGDKVGDAFKDGMQLK